jgi:hypothetical protein
MAPRLTGVPSNLETANWGGINEAHFIHVPPSQSAVYLVRTTPRTVIERAQRVLGSAVTGAWSDDLSNRMDSALRQRGLPALPSGAITREHLRTLLWLVVSYTDGSRAPGDVIWLPRTITALPSRNTPLPVGPVVWRTETTEGIRRAGAAATTSATGGSSSSGSSSSGSSGSSSGSSSSPARPSPRPPARPAATPTQASMFGGWKGYVAGTVVLGVAALGLRAVQKRDAEGPMPPPRPTYPTRASNPRPERFDEELVDEELPPRAHYTAPPMVGARSSSSASRARALLGS